MPGWTVIDTNPTQGCTFQRPLDVLELWFLWHGLFNGTTDGLHCYEVHLLNRSKDLFSEANIVRAWLSTKRRYPLAGATICGADNTPLRIKPTTDLKVDDDTGFTSEPHFVVREHDLAVLRPQEIIFGQVTDAEEAKRKAMMILHGPRPLSEELLVQLYVSRETNPEKTGVLHLMILAAHCVLDRLGNNAFVRCLLDTLARDARAEPTQIPLEERLAMAVPLVDLEPQYVRSLSPGIRRWRRAVGMVIFQLREVKRQGGQTLPCRVTHSTWYTPAKSGLVTTYLRHAETIAVISNCRLHGITFGNAVSALAQVAMTRVLYRRYLRGEISNEEWEYRKRQPYITGGPFNLRPYLDNAWFENGGGGEPMLSIGLFLYQLPFMTLGETTAHWQRQHTPSDGAPPFSVLLTFNRFLHRVGLIKRQATTFFRHPLFFEIVRAMGLVTMELARLDTVQWMKRLEAANSHDLHSNSDDEVLAVKDVPMVPACVASSLGNVNLVTASEYPLPPTHPLSPYSSVPHPAKAGYITPPSLIPPGSDADVAPKIVVRDSRTYLHTRPGELYLGVATLREQLEISVFYDENVFEEAIVREWMDEVKAAVLWYLGQMHQSHRAQESQGSRAGETGCGRITQSKL